MQVPGALYLRLNAYFPLSERHVVKERILSRSISKS